VLGDPARQASGKLGGVSARGAIFQEHVLLPETADGAIWPYSLPDRKPAHFHGQLEFVVVLRGSAQERIGNQIHSVHAGQLIWHLPGVEHVMLQASRDLDLRVVHVEPDLAVELAPRLRKRPAGAAEDSPRHAFSGWVRDLGWLAAGRPVVELTTRHRDGILEECEATSVDDPHPAQFPGRLRRALEKAWVAARADHDEPRGNSLVELACCLLLEEPSLDRPAVCRALDVSPGYLSRRFQAELGLSFLEQRARLRVIRFIGHVVRDHKSLLEAALLAGFGSYSQLYRVFVRVIGMGPSQYLSAEMRNRRGVVSDSPEGATSG
jgi:AraC-like DNA-binding protein